jgi:hypothetical protein
MSEWMLYATNSSDHPDVEDAGQGMEAAVEIWTFLTGGLDRTG